MPRSDRSTGRLTAPFLLSRRQALLVSLAGLLTGAGAGRLRADTSVPTTQVPTAARPKSLLLFSPDGAGARTGRDWHNAMPIDALSKALGAARPGSAFLIGLDYGSEPVALDKGQVVIRSSGNQHDPVIIQAGLIADGNRVASAADARPFFKSGRPWSVDNFKKRGSSYFAITEGASHLQLSGFRIDGTPADGFFKFRGKDPTVYQDILISDIDARNVGRVIETEGGATLRNLTVSDCRAVGIVRGFARFRDLSDSVFRNMELDAANMDAGGSNVCQLIAVSAGQNLLFENITLRNAMNQPPPPKEGKKPGYVQGDGIVCERNTRNITIRNCHASHMGDGGFDLKTTNVTLEDCSADTCKFGARIWVPGDNVIRRCSFSNPVSRNDTQGACIQAGGTLEIEDSKLKAGPGTVAISLSHKKDRKPPHVVMRGGSIDTEGDEGVVHANGDGVLEVYDVAINGVRTTHRYMFEKKQK